MTDDDLRRRLAAQGIGLFHPAEVDPQPPVPAELAALIAALAAADDSRLVAALPCVFVLHDGASANAVTSAYRASGPIARERLGLAWRLARSFAFSHDPDIVYLFGRSRRLPPLAIEPADLPDPAQDFGERCPAIARELHDQDPGGNLVIDFVDLFRAWLRLAETERRAAQHA